MYDHHAASGELEVATLRLDGNLAAYVIALADPPAYRVFDAAMVVMILASPHRVSSASRACRFPAEPMMRLSVASAQWQPVTGKDWRQS